jgi:methionyl-tRNA formyltransferase
MKVVVITSSDYGAAAHHIPVLAKSGVCEVAMVIHCGMIPVSKPKFYKRKLQKIFKIGIAGAVNGIRMRKWYNEDVQHILGIKSLKEVCEANNIPLHATPSVNSSETARLIQSSGADMGLSLGNGYIAKRIFSIPKFGMINIHHEILPEYQNAQSVIWQIYNMSDTTGYTIHKIDDHIDTGAILYQEKMPILFKETLGSTVSHTFAELLEASSKGLVKVVADLKSLLLPPELQERVKGHTTPTWVQFRRMLRNFEKLSKSRQNNIS